MRYFLEFFVPLFVTIDAIGLIPIFIALTQAMPPAKRRRVAFEAVSISVVICAAFLLVGKWLFEYLGISTDDFRIAGGVLLLGYSLKNLLGSRGDDTADIEEGAVVSVVPLAMPLIAGPATLVTTVVLAKRDFAMTGLSLTVNFAILLLTMLYAERLSRLLGSGAMRAFSRLVMVLLAAVAVNFIRVGVENLVRGVR